MLSKNAIIKLEKKYLLQNYSRPDLVFAYGRGSYLYDTTGKPYLDFVAGIAVNSLGHHHKSLLKAINEQAAKLVHITNLYHYESHVKVAELLVKHSFADRVFFCNSGTEAMEAAIKLSRKYAYCNNDKKRTQFVSFNNSFHGRTYGALSATAQAKYQKGFGPLCPGFKHIKVNDIKALKNAVTHKTAAVIIEPVMGEGGVRPVPSKFLRELKLLCRKQGALLIFD
ncbi:MAG: aminotransferase class III-fold pyridoxal phosphate-dependent enzyme, partial [bacterium]